MMMRTITELVREYGDLWVYLNGEAVSGRFLRDAEREGFSLSNGTPPTQTNRGYVMAVHGNGTLAHLPLFVWWRSFHGTKAPVGAKIDYERYVGGEADFICRACHFERVELRSS